MGLAASTVAWQHHIPGGGATSGDVRHVERRPAGSFANVCCTGRDHVITFLVRTSGLSENKDRHWWVSGSSASESGYIIMIINTSFC